jgi:hypothetical protein
VGTIVLPARHIHALVLHDQPTYDQHTFPWVIINFIYFYTPTVTGLYPSDSLMDGSAIDSILPTLSVFVTVFKTIVQRGELQTFIPAVLEERTSPVRTFLLSCMFFVFSPVRLFFKPPLLLLVFLFQLAFLLLLTLPLVKENTRSHEGPIRRTREEGLNGSR